MTEKNKEVLSRREFLQAVGFIAGGTILAAGICCEAKEGMVTNAAPEAYRYSLYHSWVRLETKNRATLGITHKFWNLVTNRDKWIIMNYEYPQTGDIVKPDGSFGSVETYKIKTDLISPVSGIVLEVNKEAMKTNDVYGKGWVIVLQLTVPEQVNSLMTWEEYQEYIAQPDSS